jgi:hypothetical protein
MRQATRALVFVIGLADCCLSSSCMPSQAMPFLSTHSLFPSFTPEFCASCFSYVAYSFSFISCVACGSCVSYAHVRISCISNVLCACDSRALCVSFL